MVWTTRVSNPLCYPYFRASASVLIQKAAFATGVLHNIYEFHLYTMYSAILHQILEKFFNIVNLYQYFYILVKNLFFTNFKNSIYTEKFFLCINQAFKGVW